MSDSNVIVSKTNLLKAAKSAVSLNSLNKQIEDIIDLVVRKDADYKSAWQRYGIYTPLIRINDKILRVANLADGKAALVAEEHITDILKDIVGYALLALLWLENQELQSQFDETVINAWKNDISNSFHIPPYELDPGMCPELNPKTNNELPE